MGTQQNDVFDNLNAENGQIEKCDEIIRHNIEEYADLTGIHGIRYLTEKRTNVEKIIWLIILLLAIAGCFYMIYEILDKYLNSPVLVTFSAREMPIFEIPFPAITICPITKVPKNISNYYKVGNKHKIDENLTDTTKEYLKHVKFFCNQYDEEQETTEFPSISEEQFYKALENADSQLLFDKYCMFRGKDVDCNQILHKILTDVGICYSFNILDGGEIFRENKTPFLEYYNVNKTSQWTIENGYYKNAGIETYPQRALFYGADDGFNIMLMINQSNSEETSCFYGLTGFLVQLHNPTEFSLIERNAFVVPLNQIVTVAVTPELITTSDEVKRYTPKQRQCYFQHEKQLKYFKIYNQFNCNMECYVILMYKKCGCVQFYMPRDSNIPLCQPEHLECISKIDENLKYDQNIYKNSSCDCLPLCNQLSYNIQLSQSKYYWQNFYMAKEISSDKNLSISYLTVYFKDEQFFKQERNELYGIFDLISNFGGLLGLFTGWTLISIPELLYFLSLRWMCNINGKKKRY